METALFYFDKNVGLEVELKKIKMEICIFSDKCILNVLINLNVVDFKVI